MTSVFKKYFLVQTFILFILFTSCNNSQVKKPDDNYSVEQSDSARRLHDVISSFNKSGQEVVDSLKKYHLTELADSCLKFFYVVNYMERVYDKLWCKGDTLILSESEVKPTGFINKGMDQKLILISAFMNDSIPCSPGINPDAVGLPVGFTVSIKQKRIINVMVGQYTKMYFKDFKKYYDSLVISDGFKSYLRSKSRSIHPTFKRLISY